LKFCRVAWAKPRTIFDIPALSARIQDLEQQAAQPEFWDDPTAAQQTLQELNDLKSHLSQLDQWKGNLDDAAAILELLEADADDALLAEAQENLSHLGQDLDQWEIQQLLSGT
jgi:peptide chain release factor 2